MHTTPAPALTHPDRVRSLLCHDPAVVASRDYQRLLEIYCVVKAGGLALQMETTERLEQLERAALDAEIAALPIDAGADSRRRALEQEVLELQQSTRDRLAYLRSILPEEAEAVAACLGEIDAHFLQRGRPAGSLDR